MPDWIVHVVAPWIACRLLQLRYIKLENRDIALVMLGAVLPDVAAVGYLLQWMGVDYGGALLPFHTPVGSALVAAAISLAFPKWKRAFFLLVIGFATHFAFDSLLLHADGGMVLLFPFNWTWGFQLGVFPSGGFIPPMVTVAVGILLLIMLKKIKRTQA